MGGLNEIEAMIDAGSFTNEYDFEARVQSLIQDAHDGHLAISFGALSAFRFSLPLKLVSLSIDGKSLPKVYAFREYLNFMNLY